MIFETLETTENRPVRSFVRRLGRITAGQKGSLAELWPKYGLQLSHGMLEFECVFGNNNPTILHIGFGMGEALLALAEANTQTNYIGIEVHEPGVGMCLRGIDKRKLDNLKLFCADAIEVIQKVIATESLSGVELFFPDPWPKKRHQKRRIIQNSFIELIYPKLTEGGYVHFATDWREYADHMLEVMAGFTQFENIAGRNQFLVEHTRPQTKFEQRGRRLGHGVWDLKFIKNT